MKATLLLLTSLTVLSLNSCRTTSMRAEAQPVAGVDYSQYKTYEWVPVDRQSRASFTAEDQKIRDAFTSEVDRIMKRRGFTPAPQGKADLIVYAKGARMPGYRAVGQGAGAAYSPYYEPSTTGSMHLNDSTYVSGGEGYLAPETQSSIRFLISEPSTDKIVWRGKAFVTVDDSRKQIMVEDDARILARKLLAGFPPKS